MKVTVVGSGHGGLEKGCILEEGGKPMDFVGMIAPRAGLPQRHATANPCGSGALAAKPVQANQPAHLPTKQRNK